ncbi:ribbon-helix-helix protein, CopG family [Geoglobus sp.]
MVVLKNISMRPEEAELLRELAEKLGFSQSAVVRLLIREKAKEEGLI